MHEDSAKQESQMIEHIRKDLKDLKCAIDTKATQTQEVHNKVMNIRESIRQMEVQVQNQKVMLTHLQREEEQTRKEKTDMEKARMVKEEEMSIREKKMECLKQSALLAQIKYSNAKLEEANYIRSEQVKKEAKVHEMMSSQANKAYQQASK